MQIKDKIIAVDASDDLNDWESKFIAEIYKQHIEDQRPLSRKQFCKLDDLYTKYVEGDDE